LRDFAVRHRTPTSHRATSNLWILAAVLDGLALVLPVPLLVDVGLRHICELVLAIDTHELVAHLHRELVVHVEEANLTNVLGESDFL
jgi:hypothetical protein